MNTIPHTRPVPRSRNRPRGLLTTVFGPGTDGGSWPPWLLRLLVLGFTVAVFASPHVAQAALPGPPSVQLNADEVVQVNGWQADIAQKIILAPPASNSATTLELAAKSQSWFTPERCTLTRTASDRFELEPRSTQATCRSLWKSSGEIGLQLGAESFSLEFVRPDIETPLPLTVTQAQGAATPSQRESTTARGTDVYVEIPPFLPNGLTPRPYLYRASSGEWIESQEPLAIGADTGRMEIAPAMADLLVAHAVHDAPLTILVWKDAELHRLELETQTVITTDEDPETFDFTRSCACELSKLTRDPRIANACESGPGPAAMRSAKQLRKDRRRAVRADWDYLVCVDMTTPTSARVRVRTTRAGADPAAESGGSHLFSGRPVHTRVWYPEGYEVDVSLSGEATTTREYIYDPGFGGESGGTKSSVPAPAEDPYTESFHGRKGGPIKLSVQVSRQGDDAKTFKMEHPFAVTEVYLGAIRLSAGFSWAPWEREYTGITSTDTSNPGRHVGLAAGNPGGLGHAEVLAGYSLFFRPVFEGERTVTAGGYLGLGILGTDGKGIDAISSLHLGPELVIGRNFGLAITASLRRTKTLRDPFVVGDSIGDGESFERHWFTWGFGLVLNLGPRFWKSVGTARKGFAI